MATYDEELLDAAARLLRRRSGQRGKLPSARVRRSISTSYYALFHFLSEQVGLTLVGTGNALRVRRRILIRTLTHTGMRATLDKVGGKTVNDHVALFLGAVDEAGAPSAAPRFIRTMMSAFADAQAKRQDADYDLNKPLTALDARLIHTRVGRAIDEWRTSTSPKHRDFKKALCLLILLRGQLRQDKS